MGEGHVPSLNHKARQKSSHNEEGANMNVTIYRKAIEKILKQYPTKDRTWASHQLDRALANVDGIRDERVVNEILASEFGINERS